MFQAGTVSGSGGDRGSHTGLRKPWPVTGTAHKPWEHPVSGASTVPPGSEPQVLLISSYFPKYLHWEMPLILL